MSLIQIISKMTRQGVAPDTTAPVVESAVASAATTIVIALSEVVTTTTAGWSFKKNGSPLSLSSVSGSGSSVLTFTVGTMSTGDVITMSYNSSTGSTIDEFGNEVVSFTDSSVTNTISSGGGADADATAFLTATAITDPTITDAINTLVLDLKAGGVWNRCIAIYPVVGGISTTHKYNLKDPRDLDAAYRLLFFTGMTHDSNGMLFNGTTAYAKTYIDLNTKVPQYSFHGAVYNRSASIGVGDRFAFGGYGGAKQTSLDFYSTDRINAIAGDSSKQLLVTGVSSFTKLVGMSCYRDNVFNIYRDGSSLGSQTGSRVSYFDSLDPNTTNGMLYLGAFNNNETPLYFSNSQVSFASFGYGLNSIQWAALNTAVINFQTTLGRNV